MVEQTIALAQILAKMANDPEFNKKYKDISGCLKETLEKGNKIFICGNGGSHAVALHIASEFTGRFKDNKPALPVMALGEATHSTCVTNDYGFEVVFSRQLDAFGSKDDVLIAMTTSGNSKNVIEAVRLANELQMHTFSFLGKDGGSLKGKSTDELIIPSDDTARIQECHLFLLHAITEEILKQI